MALCFMQGALAWIHWALGPVVPLFLGTPWDVMRDWLLASMPVVHLRIGFRHVVLVGDAAGMKRIFQVPHALRSQLFRDGNPCYAST